MSCSACLPAGSSNPPVIPPIPRPGHDGGDDTNTAPVPATTAAKPRPSHDQKIYGWSTNAARGGSKPSPAGRLRRAYLHHPNSTNYSASDHLPTHRTPFTVRDTRCCKVPIHAPDLVKRARRSARSESRQKSWRRQADRHIALTSEPSTARHAGGPPDRWLGWSDSACCLPSLQVRPRNADFAMALYGLLGRRAAASDSGVAQHRPATGRGALPARAVGPPGPSARVVEHHPLLDEERGGPVGLAGNQLRVPAVVAGDGKRGVGTQVGQNPAASRSGRISQYDTTTNRASESETDGGLRELHHAQAC